MKALLTLVLFTGLLAGVQAQFVTPGDGETYGMDDLVSISGGVVTFDGDAYLVHQDLTISGPDALEILDDITVKVAFDKRIIVNGTLVVDPPEEVLFTAMQIPNHFRGFRFEDAGEGTLMRNTIVEYAGGIQLIGTNMLFEHCTIRHFNMSNTSAAINLHTSHPVIRHSLFLENAGAAIGGGANVQNSPQILYNEFIHNGTANTNRPQINLGPGAADTLKIVGNHIEGEYDMAGGIAVANLMSVGHTIALVKDNMVVNNRYGYAGMGSQITSIVHDNHFIDNNIQGQPMLGGSGLNFMGGITNTAHVRGNVIKGNLWGITIQNNARPNLGEEDNDLTGFNVIEANENSGSTFGLYNNTPEAIFAQFNYWGTDDEEEAAGYIVDQADDPSLGPVTYLPIWIPENLVESLVLEAQYNEGLDEDVHATIDQEEQTVHLLLPAGTDATALVPTITLSAFAMVDPPSGEPMDLSAPQEFVVTALHGEERTYTVTAEEAGPDVFQVNFHVDLSGALDYELYGFDPDTHHIFLTGDMSDWAEPGSDPALVMEMIDQDPLTYGITFDLEAGIYDYKYFSDLIGEGWYGGEWVGDPHRQVEVSSHMTVEDSFGSGWEMYKLEFVILDPAGNQIPDATVHLDGITNETGHYVFWVKLGEYDYWVQKDGFHTAEGTVEVSFHMNLEVVLTPSDTQVAEAVTTDVRVYPNPASDWIILESDHDILGVALFDLLGQQVYTAEIGGRRHMVDCSRLENGLYFLQITTLRGKETRRVILQ